MKQLLLISLVLCNLILFSGFASATDPVPDITVNNSDGPVTMTTNDTLFVSIAMHPGSYTNVNADWWGAAYAQGVWHSFSLLTMNWAPLTTGLSGLAPIYQGGLVDLGASMTIWSATGLPAGKYEFYFGVDLTMNGLLDGQIFYDVVDVYVVNSM